MSQRDDGKSLDEQIEELEADLAEFHEREAERQRVHDEIRREEAEVDAQLDQRVEVEEEARARGVSPEVIYKERRLKSLRRQRKRRNREEEARRAELEQRQIEAFETAKQPVKSVLDMRWDPPRAVRRTLFWAASGLLGASFALTIADRVPPEGAPLLLNIILWALASVVVSTISHAVVSWRHSKTLRKLDTRVQEGEPLSDQEMIEFGEGGRTLQLDWALIAIQVIPLVIAGYLAHGLLRTILTGQ